MKQSTIAIGKQEQKRLVNEFKSTYTGPKTEIKAALNSFLEDLKKDYISGYLRGEKLSGYLQDMCLAQLYARYNHLVVQGIIKDILRGYGIKEVRTVVTTHNYIDLQDRTLRKSAVRAPEGEEILVPFNMRDGIAVCIGKGNSEWLNSCSHGAGRKMSRSKAKASINLEDFRETMKDVYSTTVGTGTIDESPMAYKDTQEIINLIKETCEVKELLVPKINIKATDGGE